VNEIARSSELGDRYAEQLTRGLRLTGEGPLYFVRGRCVRMRAMVREFGVSPATLLDFGCGAGLAFALLREHFPDARILAFEPAPGLRALAEQAASTTGVEVLDADALSIEGVVDVVYCSGVFHHIMPAERAGAIGSIARAMRPGGIACIWENSPYNPGTRFIMSRVPFDEDAVLLTPRELRGLHRGAGLTPIATEYHFVFPRLLKFARVLEPALRPIPAGGQYVVVGRRG
jgi:SAM-dependent methyltransferase